MTKTFASLSVFSRLVVALTGILMEAAGAEPPPDAVSILRNIASSSAAAPSLHVRWTERYISTLAKDGGPAKPQSDTTSDVDVRIDRVSNQFKATDHGDSHRLLNNGWFYSFSTGPDRVPTPVRARWPKSIDDLAEQEHAFIDGKNVLMLSVILDPKGGSGVGVPAWLLRADNHRYFKRLRDLRHLGRTMAKSDTIVDRIAFRDPDDKEWELWVAASEPHRLIRIEQRETKRTQVEHAIIGGKEVRIGEAGEMTEVRIWDIETWDLSATHPVGVFAPPDEAKQWQERTIRPGPHTLLGELSPDFALQDLAGKEVRLAGLRGRVVVLEFWFIACGHCIIGMPKIQETVGAYPPQDAVLLTINPTDNPDQVEPFLAKKGWKDLQVLFDPESRVAAAFRVDGYPTTAVVDREGRIRFCGHPTSAHGMNELLEAMKAAVEDGRPGK